MQTFEKFEIKSEIIKGLLKADITEPTAIQDQVIPEALLGIDVIGESVTGSGKTLAYLIPLFNKIDLNKREAQAIIITPTHELTMQVINEIKKLGDNSGLPVGSLAIIGEANISRQIEGLKSKPQIIVGTIGRITELINLKKLKMHTIKTIVFDEVDRLFVDRKEKLYREMIKATLKERQILAFSASVNEEMVELLKGIMKESVICRITETEVNPNIEHYFIKSELRDKVDTLRRLYAIFPEEKILVFMNKNEHIQDVENRLKHHKVKVCAIYGANSKEERKDAMEGFRSGRYRVMIASDIAARGLDITNLNIIVNLDIPKDAKEYLHRVGRTARNKNRGVAFSIVTELEKHFIKDVSKELHITFHEKYIENGRVVD